MAAGGAGTGFPLLPLPGRFHAGGHCTETRSEGRKKLEIPERPVISTEITKLEFVSEHFLCKLYFYF